MTEASKSIRDLAGYPLKIRWHEPEATLNKVSAALQEDDVLSALYPLTKAVVATGKDGIFSSENQTVPWAVKHSATSFQNKVDPSV
ncbi:hypothetical protein BGW41_005522 [Actinomortierella wolfii]|nr:hypothetical protein BGW41_005522 [Actinomortierella wolfii]